MFLPLCAQSLQLHIEPGASGKDGSMEVALESPAGKEPLALQWEFSFPAPIQIEPGQAMAGPAAEGAQKSIRCAIQVNYRGAKNQVCRCILAGGLRPIPDGSVATVKYHVIQKTRPGKYEIGLKKAIAVTGENKKTPIKDSQAQISVSK